MRPQVLGRPFRHSHGRPTTHLLEIVVRREASEGSLLPTVEGILGTYQSRSGGKGRGYHERAGMGFGGGSGNFDVVQSGGD